MTRDSLRHPAAESPTRHLPRTPWRTKAMTLTWPTNSTRRAILLLTAMLMTLPAQQALARAGDLDPSFGIGGVVTTDFGYEEIAEQLVVQPDGGIVAVGFQSRGNAVDFALSRYTAAGTLDASFGTGGRVLAGMGRQYSYAYGAALQQDGKIVVVGSAQSPSSYQTMIVARFSSHGALDETFGSSGRVFLDFGTSSDGAAVLVTPDGHIVVAGGSNKRFALARLDADGTLDESFDGDGIVTTSFPQSGAARATGLALQSDGKLVVAGAIGVAYGPDPFALARYNVDGSLDRAFDGDGLVTTLVQDQDSAGGVADMALQPDGKIVLVGQQRAYIYSDVYLVRYNPEGSLDASFGQNGISRSTFRGSDTPAGLALQRDGKIVITGHALSPSSSNDSAILLARYTVAGVLDKSFGVDGWITTDLTTGTDGANDVAIQADGKILAAGSTVEATTDFALVRYEAEAKQTHQSDFVVSLGDSVASGHGLELSDYFQELLPGVNDDPCVRSQGHYGRRFFEQLQRDTQQSLRYLLLACSGYDSRELAEVATPVEGTSQLERAIQVNPGLVLLTVGANDLDFGRPDRLAHDNAEVLKRLRDYRKHLTELLFRLVSSTDSNVIITTYHNPTALHPVGVPGCRLECFRFRSEIVVHGLNAIIADVASQWPRRVAVADPHASFKKHEAFVQEDVAELRTTTRAYCTDELQGFLDVLAGSQEDTWVSSVDCVHPNAQGAQAYADAVWSAWSQSGWTLP